jgi:CRP-like cAMP-binding protein
MSDAEPLSFLVRKLETRRKLDADDRAALLALPYRRRMFEPSAYLVREGEPPRAHCSFVLSGFAYRQKLTLQGARQIVSLHMRGDILDLQHLFLHIADHNIQALTRLETVEMDRQTLRDLAVSHPNIGRAMWIDALVDASVFREWIVNVGRRDARARIAHLLCEFAARMESAGLARSGGYELPMTQEQIGDATGMTGVHVNRTLRTLQEDGLIHRDKRFLSFSDPNRVRAVADFNAMYLHLEQVAPAT